MALRSGFGQQHRDDGVDAAEAEQGVVHQVGAVGCAEEDDLAAVAWVAQGIGEAGENRFLATGLPEVLPRALTSD